MVPSTTESAEEFFINYLKKTKFENEESDSIMKWSNHVTLKARFHKYPFDIFCRIKESQRKYILSVLKCLDSFEPIALYF